MKLFKKCNLYAITNKGNLQFCGSGRTITARIFMRRKTRELKVLTPIFILEYENIPQE